ncbi:hypothetical protein RND81_07G198200 [Saponaria officinalis]|uniref:RING-type domain-containing protein n=1 Tax=Saponaria officinalis TaxID=3572 RepID=A0AAW1JT07_SAPOF
MGLSNFPCASEGVLPIIVMNTVMSVAILKKLVRAISSFLVSANETSFLTLPAELANRRREERGVSIVKFKSSSHNEKESENIGIEEECCVCLTKFEEGEEVSELNCKHFFHKNCLDKWFDNHHTTCPLCRSIH